MKPDGPVRLALGITVVLNAGAAILFAFPDLPLSQFAGMPGNVPALYRAMVALFLLLFAGAYAFLARQPRIDRALVAFSAIGKSLACVVLVGLWLIGLASGRVALAVIADGVIAAVFFRWLARSPAKISSAPAYSH